MKSILNSAIYKGSIRHRRFLPKPHRFRYPLFMLYLDLDELDALCKSKWYCSLERFNIVSFRQKDYFSGTNDVSFLTKPDDLKQKIIDKVSSELSKQNLFTPKISSVRMLCHARYLNFVFNPVTFYYCFDKDNTLVAILAEITNTPWGDRHAYVLPVGQSGNYGNYALKGPNNHYFDFDKQFHVSPFNPMNMRYHWTFVEPNKNLIVHMDNTMSDGRNLVNTSLNTTKQDLTAHKHFDATLIMKHHSFEKELSRTLIRFPFMTVKVCMGIYWQALKLWVKRMPFYDYPHLKNNKGKA